MYGIFVHDPECLLSVATIFILPQKRDAYAKSRNKTLIVWEGFAPAGGQAGRSAHPPSKVKISNDLIVTPFDCFYYPPPQLAADGYVKHTFPNLIPSTSQKYIVGYILTEMS